MNCHIEVLRPRDIYMDLAAQILRLLHEVAGLQEETAYYLENLRKPQNINIIAMQDGRVTGYILARPHEEALLDLLEDDPEMPGDREREMYYVDVVAAETSVNHCSTFLALSGALFEQGNRRGRMRFSVHCRASNGLSRVVKRRFGDKVKVIRRIETYSDCANEAVEYMELEVTYREWMEAKRCRKPVVSPDRNDQALNGCLSLVDIGQEYMNRAHGVA